MKTPPDNCDLCPRLYAFRQKNRQAFPEKFNAPVPSFGQIDAPLLIAGLAPGLKGANFTGRPFTGDYAGDLLYDTLLKYDFATGQYQARPDDGLNLKQCRIANSVKCVPPENKPTTQEMANCRTFFESELQEMNNLKIILALGKIAHDSVLKVFGQTLSAYKFGHGHAHDLPGGITLIDSYHCSRYNTQTRRLTTEMFEDVISRCRRKMDSSSG